MSWRGPKPMGRCRQNSWLVQSCSARLQQYLMIERLHILMTFTGFICLAQAVSGLQHLGSLWKTGKKTKECCVFCRTRTSVKTRLCWKNILVMSVIALDSSFVSLGHQLHQWIPSFKYWTWTFSRFFAFMCKRTGMAQWGIPMKYNSWVWLLVWIYLTLRMVFGQNGFYPGSQNHKLPLQTQEKS